MAHASRERILTEALRLFGEQGFRATTIAQIERAAGLSAGAGGLYRHFPSKEALLVEAVGTRLADRGEWAQFLEEDFSVISLFDALAPDGSTVDKLLMVCQLGLSRLDHNRDVTRILMRDNSIDPQVLDVFRRDEYQVWMSVMVRGLVELAGEAVRDQDWEALAAVLVGAVSHYWLISDIFGGTHPTAIEADRYLRATAEMITARLVWTEQPPEGKPMTGPITIEGGVSLVDPTSRIRTELS